MSEFKIGDWIKFKAITRWSEKPAIRKIVGVTDRGEPEVRYGGWSNFVVRQNEVIEIIERAAL